VNKQSNYFGLIVGLLATIVVASMVLASRNDGEIMRSEIFSKDYNSFIHDEDLFSFEYENSFRVRKNGEIYYLSQLMDDKHAPFKIFINDTRYTFDRSEFKCDTNVHIEICYSKDVSEEIVQNVKLFEPAETIDDKYEKLTRAETLEWVLGTRYPEKDFDKHLGECFEDVNAETEYGGHVCFAKQKGIVIGIENNFYPEQSINLWGLLKILFLTNEVNDYRYDEEFLNKDEYELMTKYHLAYDLIAKSDYEGILNNMVEGADIWPNRAIYKKEASQIMQNFLDWQDGKQIRDYLDASSYQYTNDPDIYVSGDYYVNLKEVDSINQNIDENYLIDIVQSTHGVNVYEYAPGSIFEYVFNIPDSYTRGLKDVKYELDQDLDLDVILEYTNGYKVFLTDKKSSDRFKSLKNKYAGYEMNDTNILPNLDIEKPYSSLPSMHVYTSPEDFGNLLENRTVNNRYPAYFEIRYPNGKTSSMSAQIKTRGNASRGYIKSSFTVEFLDDMSQNKAFYGDEFLTYSDEIKLRSHISDETEIKEKLAYDGFRELGYPEPDFFDVLFTVNGVDMGLYQITEPIESEFFDARDIDYDVYAYARNITSPFHANLENDKDRDKLNAHYRIKRDDKEFHRLLARLERDDKSLLKEIDTQNVFDFAAYAYLTNQADSLTHNYYVYRDKGDDLWKMFFWDMDEGFEYAHDYSIANLKNFATNSDTQYNRLIQFVFENQSYTQLQTLSSSFVDRFNENVDLISGVDRYLRNYEDLLRYDNELWNGKFLERKEPHFDSIAKILTLREVIQSMHEKIN